MTDSPECPYCGAVAHTTHEEITHMNTAHPEIVRERLIAAGFAYDEATGKWLDRLAGDDS